MSRSATYGHVKPTKSCEKAAAGSQHCAHLTGRWTDQPTEPSNAAEAECCHCGEKIEVAFRFVTRQEPGHGPRRTITEPVYDWPSGWRVLP